MTVKQFFITCNSRLQCSNLFKPYSLNNRLFARNRAYIERIFNAFRDIVYIENENSNDFSVYFFIFCTPLKIILTMTVFVRTPRQYNQVKLSLSNFAEFIRKLRLGYGANGIQNAINRVKIMWAILKSYRFYCVAWLRLFSQLSVKNTFFRRFTMCAATHVA